MRSLAGLLGFFLLVAVINGSVVQRRAYRNTEEILVPVTIIQDGEEIPEPAKLQESEKEVEVKNLQPEVIAESIAAAAVEAEQKLEAVEAAVQAERRIDEAIVEEEVKEAIKEEEDKEREQNNSLTTTLAEVPEIVAVQAPVEQVEQVSELKGAAVVAEASEQAGVVAGEEAGSANNDNDEPLKTDELIRQATQATPTQTTTQQNFVQQLIQNSPLGQFFNQITGQTGQNQLASADTAATPAPALPGLFNPVTAVQNAAQSVVNTTTQAFQGLQQFASSLGNQFQSTLSGLGGQVANDASTARPPGPIQQFVNTFIPQQAQPAPAQPGPLQGLLNIFQGNNRPQQAPAIAAVNATAATQPTRDTDIEAQTQPAAASAETIDLATNEVRDSGEANDSFEESVQPGELIIVNDDASQTESDAEQEIENN